MLTVQVTIRDIPNSLFIENHIRERAQKLYQFYQRIISCHVVIEVPQKHKHQGKIYSVRMALNVPGKELIVNRKQDEDVYVAIRDAFNALERQLENYARRRRGDVKTHDDLNRGKIVRLFPEKGFGFIETVDGKEYYFNASNVTASYFDKLSVGDPVNFLMSVGSDGLQAQRVKRTRFIKQDKLAHSE